MSLSEKVRADCLGTMLQSASGQDPGVDRNESVMNDSERQEVIE